MILVAVSSVLYLSLNRTTKLTKDYHHVVINDTLAKLNTELAALLQPVEYAGQWFASQVKTGDLNLDNANEVEAFIRGTLGSTPNVAAAGTLMRDLSVAYFIRPDNIWETADNITRAEADLIFNNLDKAKGPVWGKLIWIKEIGQTVIDYRVPIYKDGEMVGCFFVMVTVAELSRSILQVSKEKYLTPFILYNDDYVIAHPFLTIGDTVSAEIGDQADWIEGKGRTPLPMVSEFADAKLQTLVSDDVVSAGLITPIKGVEVNRGLINKHMYIIATQKIARYGDVPWTVGVYFNAEKSEFSAGYELIKMAIVGFIILVISVLVTLKVGRKLARPIMRLSRAAQAVREGQLVNVPTLPSSRISELNQASKAFNQMVSGLRERDMIVDVFGRYVPESIASSLLADNGHIEPVSRQATIFFSDIEGFTQLTEKVGPTRIVRILNAYFSLVVEVLETYGGVVTQFQGDAVLATFNVPVESDDHADRAIFAALEIQEKLTNTQFDGVTLKCRIGINTGMVIAGAVGATGRLNYTVHGDAVNLAARIESKNKEYGTNILVSKQTVDCVKTVIFQPVAQTDVFGLEATVELFTPVRKHSNT